MSNATTTRPCGCPPDYVRRQRNRRAMEDQIRVEYGFQGPYPDVATTYPPVNLREREAPTEDQARKAANDLVKAGWAPDVVARLLNVQPKS